MPIELIVIILIFSLLLMFLCYAEECFGWLLFLFILLIILSVWIGTSSDMPTKILFETTRSIYSVDGAQVISFKNQMGDTEIINLNKTLGKSFSEGSSVKLTRFKRFYAGIMYDVPDKLEEVSANPTGNKVAN